MQFIEEFADIDVSALRSYFEVCTEPFQASQLYSASRDEKFVDESLRLSKYRAITDPALFDMVQEIATRLKPGSMVVRNDITQIVYGPGGFFKPHQDYLSMKSNILDERTLLICITPEDVEVVGGETRIVVNPYYTHVSKATTTPRNALIFRKDLMHEGALLEKGSKIIVSANLWIPRKPITGVVEVSFEDTDKTCAIALEQIMAFPESFLAGFVSFTDKQLGKTSFIYKYKCDVCSYETFDVVFKTLCQMYVEPEQVAEGVEILDFFGLSPANTLINFIPGVETVPEGHCALCTQKAVLYPCGGCKKVYYCGKKCQEIDWHRAHKLVCNKKPREKDFVLFESEEETLVASQAATELQQGYIKFSVVFGEGILRYDAEQTYNIKLSPLYVCFGDYNNIYYKRVLCHPCVEFDPQNINDFEGLPLEHNAKIIIRSDDEGEDDDEGRITVTFNCDDHGPSAYANLLIARDGIDVGTVVKEIVKCDDSSEYAFDYRTEATVLPCSGEPTQVFKHFQVDSEGKTCFTAEQADAMCEYITKTKLMKRIADQINNVKFRLTQHVNIIDGAFCNESLYGTCNLVEISGLLHPGTEN